MSVGTKKFLVTVLIFIAINVVYFWSRILAWQRYGDVTPEIQMEIMQRSLASGVSVQFANGALAVVRTKDVKAIRDGFCERSFACNLPVRRSDCLRMGVYFSCSHAMDLADGRTARSLVNFHAMAGVLPKFGRVKASEFIRDGTESQVVRDFMCAHKFHCTKSLPLMGGFPLDSRAFRDCKNGFCAPEMITLPTGRYRRGTTPEEAKQLFADFGGFADLYDNEMPAMEVTLSKRIALGRFEVTVADWQACEVDKACPSKPLANLKTGQPINSITWNDVTKFYLPWLNSKLGLSGEYAYRLPSETEWEYAARAGTTTRYSSGDSIDSHVADFVGTASSPATRGNFPRNAFGLYDMASNVSEMVQDCFTSKYKDVPIDGSSHERPDCLRRSKRGGSYDLPTVYLRPAFRGSVDVNDPYPRAGFRLARTLP